MRDSVTADHPRGRERREGGEEREKEEERKRRGRGKGKGKEGERKKGERDGKLIILVSCRSKAYCQQWDICSCSQL